MVSIMKRHHHDASRQIMILPSYRVHAPSRQLCSAQLSRAAVKTRNHSDRN